MIDDRHYLNFAGSSYLGLAGHPDIIGAGVSALRQWGGGALIPPEHGLRSAAHDEAERVTAAYFDEPSALVLGAGYHFGLAAFAALSHAPARLFLDEFAHFSLHDGARASGLPVEQYRHCDAAHLGDLLASRLAPGERPIVATDGLFSTRGVIAPLAALASLLMPYDGRLIIDESHAVGVLGKRGCGAAEHHGIMGPAVLRGGSFGKGCGVFGGFLVGDERLVEASRATPAARGASPGIPAMAAMIIASLQIIGRQGCDRIQLRQKAASLRRSIGLLGMEPSGADTPIVAFSLGSFARNRQLKERLFDRGIFVYHSNYRGVGANGVVRCTVMATHCDADIASLVETLSQELESLRVGGDPESHG